MSINWNVSKSDGVLIINIVDRATKFAAKYNQPVPPQLAMDLIACHLNGNPLDLSSLLSAPYFDFVHDVWGIHRHINRATGELENCFVPRFSAAAPTT